MASAAIDVTTIATSAPIPDVGASSILLDVGEFTAELSERLILQSLFEETGGFNSSWIHDDNWGSEDTDLCDWYGVECHPGGEVLALTLGNNGLIGTSPPELLQLSMLERLSLEYNDDLEVSLFGLITMPQDEESRLQELKLSHTAISSLSGISNAPMLTHLDLNCTKMLQESFDEIYSLSSLETLYLGHTTFLPHSFLEEMDSLSLLVDLRIPYAGLTGTIPDTMIQSLTEIVTLDLSENHLEGSLPLELENLGSLQYLDLHSQFNLTGPLLAFDTSSDLAKLDLSDNFLTGTIPNNFLSGIEDKDAAFEVNLGDNNLMGSVPESLIAFSTLVIVLTGNRFSSIPESFCEMSDWMSGAVQESGCLALVCPFGTFNDHGRQTSSSDVCNVCYGQSRKFLGQTACPEYERGILEIVYNSTQGDLWTNRESWLNSSVDICEWEGVGCNNNGNVVSLDLIGNNLEGEMPAPFFNLEHLIELDISNNPNLLFPLDQIKTLSQLEYLRASNVDITATLPDETFLALTHLRQFVVANASMAVTIPTSIGLLTQLSVLDLSGNKLRGSLPTEFNSLVSLGYLDLSSEGGGLTGTLLPFHSQSELTNLDLSGNSLDGSIPSAFLSGLEDKDLEYVVDLRSNGLTGSIPETLIELSHLHLDVTGNQISYIPDSLCFQTNWMEGRVGSYGCDAILCPPSTYAPTGRRVSEEEPCSLCVTDPKPYFGSDSCPSFVVLGASEICSDSELICENGSSCASSLDETETCECATTSAGVPTIGKSCEYLPTSICHNSLLGGNISSYCANGGSCSERVPSGSVHAPCTCPVGFAGDYCEIAEASVSETTAPNDMSLCPETCQNGGLCSESAADDASSYSCDCTPTFFSGFPSAGSQCEHSATSICNSGRPFTSFCSNGGTCLETVGPGADHGGCTCPLGFGGHHCELEVPVIQAILCPDNAVCFNGGTCVAYDRKSLSNPPKNQPLDLYGQYNVSYARSAGSGDSDSTVFLCDCSDAIVDGTPFAGMRCQHPATELCTSDPTHSSFCTNGGSCLEISDRAVEEDTCKCPQNFEGPHCEFSDGTWPQRIGEGESRDEGDDDDDDERDRIWPKWALILAVILVWLVPLALILVCLPRLVAKRREAKLMADDQDLFMEEAGLAEKATSTTGLVMDDEITVPASGSGASPLPLSRDLEDGREVAFARDVDEENDRDRDFSVEDNGDADLADPEPDMGSAQDRNISFDGSIVGAAVAVSTDGNGGKHGMHHAEDLESKAADAALMFETDNALGVDLMSYDGIMADEGKQPPEMVETDESNYDKNEDVSDSSDKIMDAEKSSRSVEMHEEAKEDVETSGGAGWVNVGKQTASDDDDDVEGEESIESECLSELDIIEEEDSHASSKGIESPSKKQVLIENTTSVVTARSIFGGGVIDSDAPSTSSGDFSSPF